MSNFDWRIAALVFLVYFILDVFYAIYVIAVNKKQAALAATMTSGIYTFGALGIMTYLNNPIYIAPLAAGAFLGTYVIVKFKS